jgi:FtsZ-binding cell division protein ZapB
MSEIIYPKHIITEWKLNTKENELTFYIYKINSTFKDIFKISQYMQEKYGPLSFCGLYVVSWEKLDIDIIKTNKKIDIDLINYKEIKNYSFVKKKLLQELIIQTIKIKQKNNKIWKPIKDNIFITHKGKIINIYYGKKVQDIVEVYKKLRLYCSIKNNGDIYISFYPSLFVVSILNLSQITYVKKGASIIDVVNGGKIIYEGDSIYSNFDTIPELKMSIKEFLEKKNINNIIQYNKDDVENILKENKNIKIKNENKKVLQEKAVLGHYEDFFRKPDKNYKPKSYSFCKQCLRLDKNNYLLRNDFKEEFNIIDAVNYVEEMLNNTKYFGNVLINFNIEGINLLNQNLSYYELKDPKYVIGDNIKQNKSIKSLLDNNGIIKQKYRNYRICVDIISLINNEFVKILIDNIKKLSNNYKMNINFENIKYTDKIDEVYIKNTYNNNIKNFKPVFIIFDGTNNEYQKIKKIYSKWGVSNQLINYNKLKNLDKDLSKDKILNILLGLYFKLGKYPWMLDYKFNSDCFIGIDVSHENNNHTIAAVAYIIKDDDIQFREIGKKVEEINYKDGKEKFSDKSMENILNNLISECKKVNPDLNYIVIHRDGFCRNSEQKFFKTFFDKINIKYSIISILKKINRKIIIKSELTNKYESTICSYLNNKENFSYIISTNIRGNKIANPYKIQIIDSNFSYDLKKAVDDIHHLTYMCFHTTLKTRLPATIYYSDKSSTSHNREYIKCEKVYQKIFQP